MLRRGEKRADERERLRAPLDLRQMAALVDDLDAAARDACAELGRILDRDECILLAPEDERRRCDAMQPIGEAVVGDRPRELRVAVSRGER